MKRILVFAAIAMALGCVFAVDMSRHTFQYGNAYLYEEGIPRVIWKGGECLARTHRLEGRCFLDAKISGIVYNYRRGEVRIQVSTDGTEWVDLPSAAKQGLHRRTLPENLFPCRELHIRFVAGKKSSLRFARYQLVGTVDGEPCDTSPPRDPVSTNHLFRADYGELLPSDSPALRLWCAESGWRVPRRRTAPAAKAKEVRVCLAANETEAAQIVVCPERALSDVRVVPMGPLTGVSGELPISSVEVLRVGYVPVRLPTDATCVRADYPDPLPPQDGEAFPVPARENQPFWIRVRTPIGARNGIYGCELEVTGREAGGGSLELKARVPLRVEVFGFALPKVMTCRSMLGLNLPDVRRYHGIKDPVDEHRVFARYLREFARYRISPYNPAPWTKWSVKWNGDEPVFDWSEWDEAVSRILDEHNFNSFRLSLEGLGGGNSISHRQRAIGGVREGDPRYQVRMKAYLQGVERHLREKGWLDKAVVYWFDEPSPKDYPYVMSGFKMLESYAPGLARAITEEPVKGLVGGPNLWCSHTHRLYDFPEALKEVRGRSDQLWWYLCWLPKAPYATLFIDHPAVELRTWLWQTWQENVTGILIWQVNHWHSSYLYGKSGRLQNPYMDPMSRHSHGKCFGNGDGLLFYPPKNRNDAPVGSMRLEMLRDGIEDYEYLTMLKRIDRMSPLLKVPADISADLTHFTISPKPIERRRLELARAIERGM